MAPIWVLSVFPSIEMLLSLGVIRFGLSSVFSASGFSVCSVMHFPSPKVTDFFSPLNSRLMGCAFQTRSLLLQCRSVYFHPIRHWRKVHSDLPDHLPVFIHSQRNYICSCIVTIERLNIPATSAYRTEVVKPD